MKVLVIDCHDSFTYNLVQQVGSLGAEPVVVTCDTPYQALRDMVFDRIILSPGPGKPDDSGLCLEVLEKLSPEIPTLGVCLGHQAICQVCGGVIRRAEHLVHGKTNRVLHDGRGIFLGLPNPFTAGRYHSLVADRGSLPPDLKVCAESLDDGSIMGVRHTRYPVTGVQFHPESILTPDGGMLIARFLSRTRGLP
jgi:glutamine amidotransferase of anthranilate synthase or aminodeoxychorismate synthase